jgi:hypothetical protein
LTVLAVGYWLENIRPQSRRDLISQPIRSLSPSGHGTTRPSRQASLAASLVLERFQGDQMFDVEEATKVWSNPNVFCQLRCIVFSY